MHTELQRDGDGAQAQSVVNAISSEMCASCDPVEQITGRKVRAFISGIDTEADVATEIFVLHPKGYEGPSRSQRAAEAAGADAV